MKLALWLDSGEQGCDYTIGCGTLLIPLKAENVDDAQREVAFELDERTHVRLNAEGKPDGDSRTFKRVLLVRVEADLQHIAENVLERRVKGQLDEQRSEKYRQLNKLKRELGES